MTENQVKILEGSTFVVSDERGDIEASRTDPTGLFSFDTRFLLVREPELEAHAALHQIDEFADLQGNGYVAYQRRNGETGLENRCWKDSWDSISYRDGTLPGFPRATCELQGYAYDAKLRGARLARLVWGDPTWAESLERQAADLKRRFNRDFWVEEGEYFAIALDADDRRVDSLTSNNGHLLWSGIVRLELLDIPGRWGRVDAFARGRVDTSPPDPYH